MRDVREFDTDILIVGAGPVGIELAVAVKRAGLDYVQLDAEQVGSTISWFAPQTHFFSSPERIAIAGVPLQTLDQSKATREEYLTYLRSVVMQFDLHVHTFERVSSISRHDGRFIVLSSGVSGERRWIARRVVLVIGDMHRPRLLGVPGENRPNVSHYFADPHLYFRRRVLIVGGKNSAVEAAIRCVRVGAKVTLSYRGAELDAEHVKAWLMPDILGMIRDGRIEFLPLTSVREIGEENVILEIAGGGRRDVATDTVLLLTGYEQDPTLFEQVGVRLLGEGRRPLFNEQTMETNVPGLFVAGTAVAGTQLAGVKHFIETSHVHVERIIAALTGAPAPELPEPYAVPES